MLRSNKPAIELLTRLLSLLGNPKYNNLRLPLRAKLITAILVIYLSISILSVCIHWNDIRHRVSFFQNCAGGNILIALNSLIYSPDIYVTLIHSIKYSSFEKNIYIGDDYINNLITAPETFSWNLIWFMFSSMVTYWIFMHVMPFFVLILYVINNNEKSYINHIDTILISFHSNVMILILDNITQVIINAIIALIAAVWFLLIACSLVYIFHELKHLSCIILEIDNKIEKLNLSNEREYNISSTTETELNDLKMKYFLRYFVVSHLKIIKKTKAINKCLKYSLLVFNQNVCFMIAVELYSLFQNSDVSNKGQYIMAVISTIGSYGINCAMGQFLINKSEDLWNAIYLSSWENKPLWYKHCIKLLLIGTAKPLRLEPAGLYVLDLNFLLKVLQVSYSYSNLMLQLNSKKIKE